VPPCDAGTTPTCTNDVGIIICIIIFIVVIATAKEYEEDEETARVV
jgi:hypothetical protein